MDTFDFITQGAKAVRSGRYGEFAIEAAFRAYKVPTVDDNPEFHHGADFWDRKEKLLIRQHSLPNGRIVDFLYKDFNAKLAFPIECKQQMGRGTTDEKLAYTVDMLARSGFGIFWLIISGGGFTPRVIQEIDAKINHLNKTTNIKGRLVHNQGPFLQRAVEKLRRFGLPLVANRQTSLLARVQ